MLGNEDACLQCAAARTNEHEKVEDKSKQIKPVGRSEMELSIIRRNPMQWSREAVKATAPPLRAYHPPLPLRPESNGE
jgi:hypothetical protein